MSVDGDVFVELAWSQLCQVTTLCVIIGVTVRAFCRRRPHLAYLLWLLVVLKCLTPPLWRSPTGVFSWLTLIAGEPKEIAGGAVLDEKTFGLVSIDALPGNKDESAGRASEEQGSTNGIEGQARDQNAGSRIGRKYSVGRTLLGMWGAGAVVFGVLGLFQVLACSWVLRRSAAPAGEPLALLAASLSKGLSLRRPVRLLVTSRPMGPLVFFRPKLILPSALVAAKSLAEIEPILAHELVHVRRGDTFAGAAQLLAQVLWWFHPLVWWANREAGRERERCCDEEVVAGLDVSPVAYARSLLAVLDLKRKLRHLLVLPSLSPFEVTSRRLEDITQRGKELHRRTPRRYWLILAAACLVALPGAGWTLTTPERAPQESKAGEEPSDPARKPEPLTKDCEATLQKIKALDEAVPSVLVDVKRPLDDFDGDIKNGIELCHRFLERCPKTNPACEVKAILARFLVARAQRYRGELQQKHEKKATGELEAPSVKEDFLLYLGEIKKLAEEAASECPESSAVHVPPAKVLVDVYGSLAREDPKRAREYFEKIRSVADAFLRSHERHSLRSSLHLSVAESFLLEGRYEDAVSYLRKVVTEHAGDPEYVIHVERLYDALTGAGDLELMEALMRIVLAEYPARVSALPADDYLRGKYEEWVCIAPFWIGFVRMALGDDAGAGEWFRKQVAAAGVHVKRLEDEGKSPQNDACRIYSEFRSKAMLDWLDNFRGKTPKADFDLGSMWSTERKATLGDSRGKVFIALFRRPGDKRAESFLKEIDDLEKECGKEGIVGVTVGYLFRETNSVAKEAARRAMSEELKALGVSLPGGYDYDPHREHSLFRSVHATIGSASLVVFNKKGEMAWYLEDPRDMDRKLLRRVVERLLKE